jgi:glycerol uptake facilitator-like aquaporin
VSHPLGRRLFAIILMFGPVSGAHFNPVVSLVDARVGGFDGATPARLFAEVIATLGLLVVIFSLARTRRGASAPAAIGAYIGAAYWFTSSTSFANPAISIGRMFSNTFAGIAPTSVPGFILAQLAGGAVAIAVIRALYPEITPQDAAEALLPHADCRASATAPAG